MTASTHWDWEDAARRAGFDRERRFNAGAIGLPAGRSLIWHRVDDTAETLGGAELAALARRIAGALRRAGVRAGDRVAAVMGRRPESFGLPLALWRLGAVYVPLFSGFGPEALRTRLADSGVSAAVVDEANRRTLADAQHGLDRLMVIRVTGDPPRDDDLSLPRLIEQAGEESGVAPTRATDPATIMYTSGTSGPPKGCVIPHQAIVTLWPYVRHCLGMSARDVLFSTADTGWSFGLYTTGLAPLSLGITRLLYEGGYDAAGWWRAARAHQADHLAGAPTGYRQLAAAGTAAMGPHVPSLRAATSAGEPLNPEVIRWFVEHLGVTVHDSYGLTELGMVIVNPRGQDAPEPAPGSMGFPLPGFEVRLVDSGGEPVDTEEVGRVAVRDNGFLLSSTYWGRGQEWDSRFSEGWWVSDDLARRDEAGRYWYVGRADDVIVTAGYNVGPFEVESALIEHPLVVEAACVGVPDERKGQVIAVHVVLQGGDPPADLLERLRSWVGARVGWHAAPRYVHVASELPRTESGKLRRRALRDTVPHAT